MSPATPLPFKVAVVRNEPSKMYALIAAADESYPVRTDGPDASADAAYVVHAANAYPKLVAALKGTQRLLLTIQDRNNRADAIHDEIERLLLELGESK